MRFLLTLAICLLNLPVLADDANEPGGTLNPDEMSLGRSLAQAKRGKVGMVICAQGYLMTKMGSHADARRVFEECAKQGYTGTMTWMSYMDTNGFGGRENAQAAAEWDRRAAEAGDPIGAFNYGLDLLRGHGVRRDEIGARAYIDRAARAGVKDAIRVQESGYDPDVVTPDADNWRYDKRVF
jgi:TPR repeat protein